MDKRIGWELYRSLLAVLEEGSMSGAARALGLTQPTVSRHVTQLEAALGTTLFMRSQSGLQPTEAALALRDGAEAMHSMAASLERSARSLGDKVSGPVRISASEVVGVEVLPPILAALQAQHPGLTIELVTSNALHDLVRREADIAVRMTPPRQNVLLATRVGDVELGLHAHRSYLERCGHPASVAELASHVLIGFDRETPFLRSATTQLPVWQRDHFSWRCDSDLAQLALLRAGAGIGVCQTAIARRDPNLVRILPSKLTLNLGTWVAMHEGLRSSLRCKVTFDALVKGLRRYTK